MGKLIRGHTIAQLWPGLQLSFPIGGWLGALVLFLVASCRGGTSGPDGMMRAIWTGPMADR